MKYQIRPEEVNERLEAAAAARTVKDTEALFEILSLR